MKGKIPRITADKIIRILQKHGFSQVRQSGSHKIFRNSEGTRVTIPFHSGVILHPKIVKSILDDTGLSQEDLEEK